KAIMAVRRPGPVIEVPGRLDERGRSRLAGGAPVGGAVRVALAAGADTRAAARARLAGALVDALRLAPVLDRRAHQRAGGRADPCEVLVAQLAQLPPRVDARLPAALGLEDVPDPRDHRLVEQRVAQRRRLGGPPAQGGDARGL